MSASHLFLVQHNKSFARYLFLTEQEDEIDVLEKIDSILIPAKKMIDDNGINFADPKSFFETNGVARELKANTDFKILESHDNEMKIKYQNREIIISKNRPFPL